LIKKINLIDRLKKQFNDYSKRLTSTFYLTMLYIENKVVITYQSVQSGAGKPCVTS